MQQARPANLIIVVCLALCAFTSPSTLAQCAGNCGVYIPEEDCWCDVTCLYYNDCCPDFAVECYTPEIFDLDPRSIPTSGGELVIRGKNFGRSSAAPPIVTLEIDPPVNLDVLIWDQQKLTVVVPPGVGADLTLTLTNEVDRSATFTGLRYEPPLIYIVDPPAASERGGVTITIIGQNFGTQGTVTVGGAPLTDVLSYSHDTIVGTLPPGSPGPAAVSVVAGGQSDTDTGVFRYQRFGDGDDNGAIDGADVNLLVQCISGPDHPSACYIFDDDLDADVDLRDMSIFQREFGI